MDDASSRGAWFRRERLDRDPNAEQRILEAQRLEAGANALLDMAGVLASAASPQDVDKAIIGAANEICGSQRGLLLRWDPAAEVLKNTAWTGFSAELQESLAGLEVRLDDTQLLGVALATDEAIIVRRDTDDVWIRRTLEALNCAAAASIAIRAFDIPFSVLSLHYDDPDLDETVVGKWLRKVANLAGRAYETAAVIEAQAERVERLGGQKQILEMVARGEDLRSILETVCVTVEAHVPASMGAIFLLDKEGNSLQMVAGPTVPSELAWELSGMKPGPFSGSAGSAVFREHAVYAVDVSTDRVWKERREIAQRHGLKAAWALPIFAAGGNRVLGALTVYLTRSGRPDEGERAFMEMAAQLTSIAIERRELETQLTHQAFHDSLTGLPNRALFADRVQHALDRTARNNEPISLLLLDLDDFKSVNDTLGHPAGDELLQAVAERIRRCLRSGDTPARLGGDEFAILLEGADEVAARTIAERLLTMLQDPIRIMGIEMRISGSIGIVQGEGSRDKMDDLLRSADTAMYAAKGQGKGRFEMFEARMQSGLLRRLELQAELQRAVDDDEFVVHYQPIYRLDPFQMVGLEALVRWEHPSDGLLMPGDFIPASEESGLVVQIGDLVLRKVCSQAKTWIETGHRRTPVRIGVNFSVKQLQDPSLVDQVRSYLQEYEVPAETLVVEITESVLLEDPEDVAVTLSGLKELGLFIAIDDFGTGYSSLSYLRRFPVDILKIDRFFVQGMDGGPEEAAYGRAMVRLGHSLGLDVVAEGVETPGERDALLEMGCDFGQGFLFSRPVAPEELEELTGFRDRAEDAL